MHCKLKPPTPLFAEPMDDMALMPLLAASESREQVRQRLRRSPLPETPCRVAPLPLVVINDRAKSCAVA